MSSKVVRLAVLSAVSVFAAGIAAAQVQLAAVQFPESKSLDIKLTPTNRVAPAEAEAEVKFKNGQARVEVEWERLPPAVLFGGDVTSYVTWAVARDGRPENLGELPVRKPKGKAVYQTGQKEFGILITAEPHPLVLHPSELVVFTSLAPEAKKARSTPVTMGSLSSAARRGNEQVGSLSWSGTDPIDLVQAQNVLTQAQAIGAEQYNADAIREATTTLAQATNAYHAGNDRVGTDYARRSLTLSSTAIRDTQRRLAEQAAAAEAARRAAEMQSLEDQRAAAQRDAATAQQQALSEREKALSAREAAVAAQAQLAQEQQQLAEAQRQAQLAQSQVTSLQQQADQARLDATQAQERAAAAGMSAEAADAARKDAEDARLRAESLATQAQAAQADADRSREQAAAAAAALDSQRRQLESQTQQLQEENTRLKSERDDLAGRLTGALSEVATISQSARGVVVNLPDILFDTNMATLKPNAQVALGKLSGILSLFPKINLRIEGHTDSTGSDELNDRLSRDRANSVMTFLQTQGVAGTRMTSEGYGKRVPVADNATPAGRAKNRRVEIILAEGVIQGAQ
ncbi:MAG TPA: OmpA family protein [Thermoanaerobaculia bacterium]|nr:OmpA family protein [Thermoanaerobaculia bacterium]